ncbi:uncharacterized protein YdaU (DUF1376 family) [Bradyrhizobium sp. S3.9.2]|uniref:YdaU family protein n=1 Tax=Bradyrhizobium sp. S3.9.2 TaxID=3156432 RepID=UPI0033934396
MPRPWMPMYWGDYIADTGHLSTVQHGAYCLLIAHYWRCGSLPTDDQQLANITGLSLWAWKRQRPTLQAFFYDGWRHKRVEAELAKHETIRARRAVAGSKGGTVASINRFRRR